MTLSPWIIALFVAFHVLLCWLYVAVHARRSELEQLVRAMIVSGRIRNEYDTAPVPCPRCSREPAQTHDRTPPTA